MTLENHLPFLRAFGLWRDCIWDWWLAVWRSSDKEWSLAWFDEGNGAAG